MGRSNADKPPKPAAPVPRVHDTSGGSRNSEVTRDKRPRWAPDPSPERKRAGPKTYGLSTKTPPLKKWTTRFPGRGMDAHVRAVDPNAQITWGTWPFSEVSLFTLKNRVALFDKRLHALRVVFRGAQQMEQTSFVT